MQNVLDKGMGRGLVIMNVIEKSKDTDVRDSIWLGNVFPKSHKYLYKNPRTG